MMSIARTAFLGGIGLLLAVSYLSVDAVPVNGFIEDDLDLSSSDREAIVHYAYKIATIAAADGHQRREHAKRNAELLNGIGSAGLNQIRLRDAGK